MTYFGDRGVDEGCFVGWHKGPADEGIYRVGLLLTIPQRDEDLLFCRSELENGCERAAYYEELSRETVEGLLRQGHMVCFAFVNWEGVGEDVERKEGASVNRPRNDPWTFFDIEEKCWSLLSLKGQTGHWNRPGGSFWCSLSACESSKSAFSKGAGHKK